MTDLIKEQLAAALKNLMMSCYKADLHEELSEFVDGSLLDSAEEALAAYEADKKSRNFKVSFCQKCGGVSDCEHLKNEIATPDDVKEAVEYCKKCIEVDYPKTKFVTAIQTLIRAAQSQPETVTVEELCGKVGSNINFVVGCFQWLQETFPNGLRIVKEKK